VLGLPQDTLCTKGIRTTAGSRILENYRPPYSATAVERLLTAGALMVGKCNCDAFAMGSTTEASDFHVRPRNPKILNPKSNEDVWWRWWCSQHFRACMGKY
jgi:Asp-tRNA(Asn)/Glu-tRNA(Gln) amidotransferase A subunit family amidase